MKNALRSVGILLLTLFGSLTIFIFVRTKDSHKETLNLTEKKTKTTTIPKIRDIAESKLDPHVVNSIGDLPSVFSDSQSLKSECREVGIDIAKIGITELGSDILHSPAHIACLIGYGFNRDCVDKIAESICKKNLTISRAKIIAAITDQLPIHQLSPEIAANRAIALIFSPQSPQNNSEIYQLSSKLLEKFPDLVEAHNLRSFYGFQSIKDKWDENMRISVGASAAILKASPDVLDHKKGLMVEYGTAILKYFKSKTAEDLEDAEAIASSYVSSFANESAGYYMLMQTSGYRGDAKKALEHINKGLSFGPNQDGYSQYLQVKESLDSGLIDINILGLRIELESYFKIESLLDSNVF